MYENVSCCVKVNGFKTNWFEVTTGLKQGCLLSPLLFNMYVNDLVESIKEKSTGVPIGDENVCVLMYADDLVLLARNEKDLQNMLDSLHKWCCKWTLSVNSVKSDIVLGIVLNEFLDYNFTAKIVAKAASRALGLLISKTKLAGGIPESCFTHLYKNMVLSVNPFCFINLGCNNLFMFICGP